jgi:hypothetical protein
MCRASLVCLTVFVLPGPLGCPAASGFTPSQAAPPSAIFRIETDEFWLNLHHFLYVLGRAQGKTGDATREAVADAPSENARGFEKLTAGEQTAWKDAVNAYSSGLSLRDAVREDPTVTVTAMLADADDAPTLAGVAIDASVRQALERAAPIYRKAWWSEHRAANRAWRASIERLVAEHGETVRDFIVKAYGLEWPTAGFAVHAARFSNWAGAYSSARGVLVIASGYGGNSGLRGLEGLFHEGMHQWDGQMYALLGAQAKHVKATVPVDMPHALIWVTAGEAVRRLDPTYVRTVDAAGIWNRGSSGAAEPLLRLKAPLEEIWLPYLAGRGTRDEALAALLARINSRSGDAPVVAVANLVFHSAFWVNLHHVMFTAAWAKRPDTGGRRLIGPLPAPLAAPLSEEERTAWNAAVAYYEREIADRDLRGGIGMTSIKRALVAEDLAAEGVGTDLRAVLEGVAPIYRRYYWPEHDRANRDWIRATGDLLRSIERDIVQSHERLYGRPWFSSPVRVDVVWAGRAYTTLNPVTHATVSPAEGSGLTGWTGVEIVLHEVCHELILPTEQALAAAFGNRWNEHGALWHVIQFYLTGQALKQLLRARAIDYTPYMYSTGLFDRAWRQYRKPVEEHWQPYIRGEITRAQAIERTVAAMAAR